MLIVSIGWLCPRADERYRMTFDSPATRMRRVTVSTVVQRRQPLVISALRRGPASSTRCAGTSTPKRMLDCASPTDALAVEVPPATLRPVSSSAAISAASSEAPRSIFVSTYSGTTSRSSPGNTTRCRTRSDRPASVALLMTVLPLNCRHAIGEQRADVVVVHAERGPDRHVHVEVLVGAQAAAEEHARLALRHLPVIQQPRPVRPRVDRVVRLVAAAGQARVLTHDHCLVLRVPIALRVEMPELVDTGERHILVGVVHDRRPLEVARGEHLHVEIERAPAQVARSVSEVGV